jgi:hypothetical protein
VCLAQRRETKTKTGHDPQEKKKKQFRTAKPRIKSSWALRQIGDTQENGKNKLRDTETLAKHHTPFLSLLSLHCPLALSFVFVRSICDGNCFVSVPIRALFSSCFRSFTLWR